MSRQILWCPVCKRYSMKKECSSCGRETILPRPPKFSLQDKYVEYRRKIRKEELREKGLY